MDIHAHRGSRRDAALRIAALALLLLQAGAVLAGTGWAPSLVNIAASLLAVVAAVACGRRHGWAPGHGWGLLVAAWGLWALGATMGLQQRLSGVDVPFPAIAGVLYLLGILPLLLAISLVGLERRDPVLGSIDLVLVAALGALYCGIRLRAFGEEFGDVDPVLLADMQNGFLVLLALMRRAAAENDRERRFFGVLFPFLLLRLATTAAYNRILESDLPAPVMAWAPLLPGLPFLLFTLLVLSPRLPAMWPGAPRMAPFARAISPLAVTVMLLLMSALVVARGAVGVGMAGIVLGVFGYGFRSTLLLVRTEAAVRRLHELARLDDLTGIANRRSFDEMSTLAWAQAARDGRPVALMMVDIDHFKALNDRLGHTAGDECLRRVARTLTDAVDGPPGAVARIGGEEFAVLLTGADADAATRLAERMREAVQALEAASGERRLSVTVSIGVASASPREGAGLQQTLMQADRMLYEAKRGGRNRVCTAADERFATPAA